MDINLLTFYMLHLVNMTHKYNGKLKKNKMENQNKS